MPQHPIYGLTSIGRPLDKSYATNRAVSMLLPVGAVVAAGLALLQGDSGFRLLSAALAGAAVVFGAWAMARELAPDDNAAAFVSMGLGFVTLPLLGPLSFLILFTTMFLVRIVNRSVGLPARTTDSVAVTLLVWLVMYLAENPLFGAVAAIAFVLDAVLQTPLRRQWVFAALCLGGTLASQQLLDTAMRASWSLNLAIGVLLAAITVAYLVTLFQTRVVHACGDVTGEGLSLPRVRMGMLVSLLVAFQTLSVGEAGLAYAALLWAAMTGVAVTALVVRVRKKMAA